MSPLRRAFPATSDETKALCQRIQEQQRQLAAIGRELDALRAERDVLFLFGYFKASSPLGWQDELTLRFSRMGLPGCGGDPD